MEQLITLRSLGSQLKPDELQCFVDELFETFGMDVILSFIFNNFLIKYNQNKEHNNDLQTIISIIQNILNEPERMNKSSNKNEDIKQDNTETKPTFSMNTIPSHIIGKCASYLEVQEYLHFSESNREIYIACNSPNKLQEVYFGERYYTCDLNRFVSLKKLFVRPSEFNKYIDLHPNQKQFNQLNTLGLRNEYSNNNEAVNTFMNTKCINFQNISYLSIRQFGGDIEYDFTSFINMLMKFPNLIALNISKVYLTDFIDDNNILKLFPKLSMISIDDGNESVHLFRNRLLNIHSNNIISLKYDESIYNTQINISLFPKLKELAVHVDDANMDSLHNIIKNAPDLERFNIRCYGHDHDDRKMKKIIITLFNTCEILFQRFVGPFCELQKIIKFIEIASLNTKDIVRKSLMFLAVISDDNIEIDEMNLNISQITTALDKPNINNFMVTIRTSLYGEIDKTFEQSFEQTSKILKNKYLVNLDHENCSQLSVSNKQCTINGYWVKWCNKLVAVWCNKL